MRAHVCARLQSYTPRVLTSSPALQQCFSECPLLTARAGAAYVKGVQSTGTGACAKHFVGNDLETDRGTICVELGERALREVYLVPFEALCQGERVGEVEGEDVGEGGGGREGEEEGVGARGMAGGQVASVMTAYNRVNGHYAAESPLLREVVREEWRFRGFFVSDWWGNHRYDQRGWCV